MINIKKISMKVLKVLHDQTKVYTTDLMISSKRWYIHQQWYRASGRNNESYIHFLYGTRLLDG